MIFYKLLKILSISVIFLDIISVCCRLNMILLRGDRNGVFNIIFCTISAIILWYNMKNIDDKIDEWRGVNKL